MILRLCLLILNCLNFSLKNDEKSLAETVDFFGLAPEDLDERPSELISCSQKTTKSFGNQLEFMFDTGFETCGWEIDQIKYLCSQQQVQYLGMRIRHVNYPDEIRDLINMKSDVKMNVIQIPQRVFPRKIIANYLY